MSFVRNALLSFSFALLLAACASPGSTRIDETEADVIARLGKPVDRHTLRDGSVNLEYSTAPFGQEAWMINIVDGRVRSAKQVLTMEEFATVRIGVDRFDDIRAHFGRTVDEVNLRLAQRTVWSYRMLQDNQWWIWMNVQFDRDGIVREVFPTPDPATISDHDSG